jgi:hypothetical protein
LNEQGIYRRKDIVKLNLKEILREGVAWINLYDDKDQWQILVNTIVRGRPSYNAVNLLNI